MTEHESTALPVLQCTQAPVITENLMDMAATFQAQQDFVAGLNRSKENLRVVKELRAAANKQVEQLEQQRKAVKAAVMAPYNAAERIYKGFVTEPHQRLDETCKAFVDLVEGEMKEKCETRLKSYFAELCAMKGMTWLKWERLGIKVDMATAQQKNPVKAMDSIRQFVDRVAGDLDVIGAMEDSAALLAIYESCLDIGETLRRAESRRQAERIAQENRQERQRIARQAEDLAQEAAAFVPGLLNREENLKKFTVTFSVTATTPMLRGLKAFLDSKGYEYKEDHTDD